MQSWQSTTRSAETWRSSTPPHGTPPAASPASPRPSSASGSSTRCSCGTRTAIFPALENVAPLVAEAYEADHRGLDATFDALSNAVDAKDPLDTARATAAFKFHLDHHLAKEDNHVYRLIRERVSIPDQGKAVGVMANGVPQARFPELVAWMYPLLGHDDRENMTRIWQVVMPPEAFAGAVQLVQKAIGNDFGALVRRIPALAPSNAPPAAMHAK